MLSVEESCGLFEQFYEILQHKFRHTVFMASKTRAIKQLLNLPQIIYVVFFQNDDLDSFEVV